MEVGNGFLRLVLYVRPWVNQATRDITEQATVYALKQDWGVAQPFGDYLPYDLMLDVNRKLWSIQVKSAWFDATKKNYVVDTRRTRTNPPTHPLSSA